MHSSDRECVRELGEPVMNKAYQLLDKADPEQAEVSQVYRLTIKGIPLCSLM